MSITATPAQLSTLSDCLLNTSRTYPLHERFRALFTLKAVGGPHAVSIIARGFADPSPLLKHELAYVLGQIGEMSAVHVLEGVVRDVDGQGEMVRHEAAEALGALSSLSSLPLLKHYAAPHNEPSRSVRETCEIAVAKIEYENTEEGKEELAKKGKKDPNFPTIDPATASLSSAHLPTPLLRSQMLDTALPLFERYRAMFALRNRAGPTDDGRPRSKADVKEAVEALAEGFNDSSALFRHEIAYIFGQLSSPFSIPSLLRVLRDSNEDEMVRHEAAEALGGIASESESESADDAGAASASTAITVSYDNEEDRQRGVLDVLREWSAKMDAPVVVRESCQVAVDMYEYETSNQFQYADKLADSTAAAADEESTTTGPRLTGMDRGVSLPVVA